MTSRSAVPAPKLLGGMNPRAGSRGLLARLRESWGAPGGMLRGMRAGCLALGYVAILSTSPLALGASNVAMVPVTLAALATLGAIWTIDHRRGRSWLGWTVPEAIALVIVGTTLGAAAAVSVVYAALTIRGVSSTGYRIAVWIATYIGMYVLTVVLLPEVGRGTALLQVPGLAITGAVIFFIVRLIVTHETAKATLATQAAILATQAGELARKTRDLEAVVSMGHDISRSPDGMRPDLLAQHIVRAVGADEGQIAGWDRAAATVVELGCYPARPGTSPAAARSLDEIPHGRDALVERRAVVLSVTDETANAGVAAFLAAQQARSVALVPLVVNGQAIGLVQLVNRTAPALEPGALVLAQTLADEAGTALENARLYDQLRHQAVHDPLTGLPNRLLFQDRVEHALARRREGDRSRVALMFIDIDDFKRVNDEFGHDVGDAMLRGVAERLGRFLRVGDTLARFGGDEFALLLENVERAESAEAVAERMLASFREPVAVGDREIVVGLSIGIDLARETGMSTDELMRNADFAMYTAKAAGKQTFRMYEAADRAFEDARAAVAAELVGVVDRNELRLQYQPIVELRTGRIIAFEALVRWDHPTRGLLAPADFIATAEETGAIVEIGAWVLERACHDLRTWQRADRPLGVSVNISGRQFQHGGLVETVRAAVQGAGIDPSELVLEVTETYLLRDGEAAAAQLAELKGLGVRLAIDDFGTGYASLSYLRQFPVDILKIDREFTDDVNTKDGGALLRGIVQLSKVVGVDLIAEGIERSDQVHTLIDSDLDVGQGYLMARAMDVDAVDRLLEAGDLVLPTRASAALKPRRLRGAALSLDGTPSI